MRSTMKVTVLFSRQIDKFRGKGIRAFIHKALKLITLILASPIAVIVRGFGIRFSSGNRNNSIGHLVTESLFMELQNRAGRHFSKWFVLLLPEGKVANSAVLQTLPDNFLIIRDALCCKLLSVFKWHPLTKIDMNRGVVSMSGAAFLYKHTIN